MRIKRLSKCHELAFTSASLEAVGHQKYAGQRLDVEERRGSRQPFLLSSLSLADSVRAIGWPASVHLFQDNYGAKFEHQQTPDAP